MLELDKKYPLGEFIDLARQPQDPLESRLRKKNYEAGVVGIALSRIASDFYPLTEQLQVVIPDDRYDKAPDAFLLVPENRVKQNSIGLEVVSFTKHSEDEGLIRFFYRTKLSGLIRYPNPTGILCHVCFNLKNPERTCKKISEVLTFRSEAAYPVYMICEQKNSSQFLAQVYSSYSRHDDCV